MMQKYYIRFNFLQGETDKVWSIFDNGYEYRAKHLKILTTVFDECTFEDGKKRWNFCCVGELEFIDGIAIIK